MKTKKPMAWSALAFAAALSLVACGDQEAGETAQPEAVETLEQDTTETVGQETSETVYERKTHDSEETATFTHVGDKILQQHGVYVTTYEAFGFAGPEEAQEVLDPRIAELNAIDEYEHTIDYGETHITEEIIANYAAMDPADVVKLPGMDELDTTEDAEFYSLEETAAGLETSGYIKVE
ncbi:DUF1307 domain-containing protein [Enteractinococcus coprophilus]|uniref:Uncharacterized lipoprotein YehR (DUF1307 family) n=1 Tax=Enteractinococcus coprophilus TaxID=1027633 RepID=A0A543AP51_9MICC|nr:DUF1307 domain-containing protein [Enteractinococcus coprophilus]TQL74352.1 uncharacterized lipoprotein YehR (DUF1307 family) [Enteractinococcus coprophilus]